MEKSIDFLIEFVCDNSTLDNQLRKIVEIN